MINEELNKIHQKLLVNGKKYDSVSPSPSATGGIYSISQGCAWTDSFYVGMLWLDYMRTKDPAIKANIDMQMAEFKQRMKQKRGMNHHDIGFLYTLSAVAGFKLTACGEYRDMAVQAAELLCERYHPEARCIQAWGSVEKKENYRLIIDCMLNIPLLYWAARTTGEKRFYDIAYNHAKTTMANIFRPDYSTYHTFYFDYETGKPLYGKTKQGASDDSTWSRGQAWAIYGFALSYRYTGDAAFLNAAKNAADYFIEHLPSDGVSFWDLCFNDGDDEPRDTSAAAIAVCGLLEIDSFIGSENDGYYRKIAEKIVTSLCKNYMSSDEKESILDHGVYSIPDNVGIDEACIWGDYYILEALTRLFDEEKYISLW